MGGGGWGVKGEHCDCSVSVMSLTVTLTVTEQYIIIVFINPLWEIKLPYLGTATLASTDQLYPNNSVHGCFVFCITSHS